MKGGEWCNFEWDKDAFPEPEAMLGRIKQRGLKICLWINPYIAQKSRLFEAGKKERLFYQEWKRRRMADRYMAAWYGYRGFHESGSM